MQQAHVVWQPLLEQAFGVPVTLTKRNISFAFLLLIIGWVILYPLPDPLFNDPYSTVLESREGDLLGARIAADGQWRFPVSDTLFEKYITCVIVYEDRYFYFHHSIIFKN